jgi:DNA-binding NtrC family response regulator
MLGRLTVQAHTAREAAVGDHTDQRGMNSRVKGAHPVVRAILSAAGRLAGSRVAVLIVGERGTGKELLARHLHLAGGAPEAPFVRIDCAEGSELRLEQALFNAGAGLERANRGTLFLDDLGALPMDLQGRLLAALQGGPGRPRIVASCANDAAEECRLGRLSAALRRFLDPVELLVPSLRQRRADIPVLAEHFLSIYAERHHIGACRFDAEALVHLWQYDWPGNVRELESVVERVVVLCRAGVIRTADLPPHLLGAIGSMRALPPTPPRVTAPVGAGPNLRPLA